MISHQRRMPASRTAALLVWVALCTVLSAWGFAVGTPAAVLFCLAAPLLWVTGLRAVALWMRAARVGRHGRAPQATTDAASAARVALLYCVANDADLRVIAASARQDRAVATVILDDSTDLRVQARIDDFAATHGARVVRRDSRNGYKAGNLNHGLAALRGDFDAYVLCDSDVVLPPDFVRRTLPHLADPTVAVVQAAPTARPGETWFARYFGSLLGTYLSVARAGREATGVVALLGRGALVRATALDDVGGVPHVVAEDLALTVALRRRGWRLVNADLAFVEDYPVDYRSFRTQLRKTTEGAVEFVREHVRPGALRGLSRGEALDLLVDAAIVPLAALAGVITLITGAALAAAGTPPPLWAALVAAATAVAPLLPETVRRARTRGIPAAGVFLLIGAGLYTSTMFVILGAVLRMLVGGRAVFWITPKSVATPGWRQTLLLLRAELILVPVIALLAVLASGAGLSALAPMGAALLAVAFAAPGLRRAEPTVRHPAPAPRVRRARRRSARPLMPVRS